MENLHAVFKHETFTALPYSHDFWIITKESLKRVTKWASKYFTHEKSYYRVSHTSSEFANLSFVRSLPSEEINPETESAMKEFVERYRLFRHSTVREETTKGKARTLPPAVYTKQQDSTKVDLLAGLGNNFNAGDQPVGLSSDKGAVGVRRVWVSGVLPIGSILTMQIKRINEIASFFGLNVYFFRWYVSRKFHIWMMVF